MKKQGVKKKITSNKASSAPKKVHSGKKTAEAKDDAPKSHISFRLDPLKVDLVRQTLITVLWKKEEVTFLVLTEEIKREIGRHFNGDIEHYIHKVSNDLAECKLMEEVPGKQPLHYRLSQKLDSGEQEQQEGEEEADDSLTNL